MKSLKNPESNKKDSMDQSSSVIGALASSEYMQGDDILNQFDDKNSSIDLNLDNHYDDRNGQKLLFDHNEQLKSFITDHNLKFSKSSSLNTKEQSNNLFSLINNITGDLISMKNPNLFQEDSSNNDKSINKVFKNLSFALFIAYNTLQAKNQKYQSKLQDLQKRYDEVLLVSPQKNSSGSNHSDLNYDKEYCANNESLLKSMTTKFDELTDEMHKLSLKNADQESSIERLKQQKMDLELQIDHLEKQLKNSQENSQKSTIFNSNDFISQSPASSNDDSVTSNARIFVLENDVNALSIKVRELNSSNEKKREKIKMLIKIVKDKDSKLQDAQKDIESLQIKYDKLALENEEKEDRLKSINEEFNSKIDAQSTQNGEIDNLNQALNALSEQMQEMNQEIQFECTAKNKLLEITQEQQHLLVKQEQYINVLTNKIQSLEENSNDTQIKLKSINNSDLKSKNDKNEYNSESMKKVEDEIMTILSENFELNDNDSNNDQFLNQIKEELRKKSRQNKNEDSILFITQLLVDKIISLQSNKNEINQYSNNENVNSNRDRVQRLLNYMSNLLRFIDQIANSGEVQDWIINTNQQDKDSFRQELLKQCTRIDSFLKQNYYYEYMESNNYNNNNEDNENDEENENENEMMYIDDDFLNISKKAVKQICNENQPLDELAVVFKMFASSNDFLRRFSEELKLQNDSLISDLHGIRNELIDMKNKEEQNSNEGSSSISQEPHARDINIANQNLNMNSDMLVKLYNYLGAIYQSISSIAKPKNSQTTKNHKNRKSNKNISQKNSNYKNDDDEYDYSDSGYEYDYADDVVNNDDIIQIQEMVKNCLDIIIDNSNQNSNSKSKNKSKSQQPYIDGYMIKYVSKLEKKIHKLEEVNGNLYQKIKALKSANSKQKKQFEEEVEGSKKCNEDLSSTIVDKDKSLSELETLVDHKNEEINALKRKIKENEKRFNENIETLKVQMQNNQNESQDKFENLRNASNNDILKMKKDYDDKILNLTQKINDNKFQFKSEIKKIQAEYEAEIQRSMEIRDHFESLTSDLKNKLQDSKAREKNEKDEKLKAARDIADLKAELSKLRIENKMMSMKLQANEEKFNRERDHRATQNRMNILKLESDKEREINEIKESSSMNFHKFLKEIFEIFSDFIAPSNNGNESQGQPKLNSKSISKENAFSLMNRVNDIAKQADRISKENAEYQYQFNEIKEILMINDNNDNDDDNGDDDITKLKFASARVIQVLKDTVNNRNNISKNGNKKQKPGENNLVTKRSSVVTARDWEVWARRLHALATDSFCTMKPAKDLQQVIEEELVSAVGQRPLFRKVEILRSEKFILQRGLGYVSRNELNEKNLKTINNLVSIPPPSATDPEKRVTNPNSLSIIQILAVVVSIRRMQKISGHLKLFFGIGSKNQNQKMPNVSSFVNNRNTNRNNDNNNNKNDCDDDFESNSNNDSPSHDGENVLTFRARKSNDKKRYPILNYVD